MASWSTKRKYGYFFAFFLGLVILFGVPAVYLLYEKPTCFDGKQNGTERGVDCSGACARLCPADFTPPKVLWSYSMKVVPGVYNAIAYAQNPNQVEAKSVPYTFKLYSESGKIIAERTGYAFVPAGQKFPVFEGGIQLSEAPVRTTFEFGSISGWRQGEIFSKLKIVSTNLDQNNRPTAEVLVNNISPTQDFSDVTAFIILYDSEDNRVAFSKTVIDTILANGSKTLYFTWPESFLKPVVRTEVLFVASPRK